MQNIVISSIRWGLPDSLADYLHKYSECVDWHIRLSTSIYYYVSSEAAVAMTDFLILFSALLK